MDCTLNCEFLLKYAWGGSATPKIPDRGLKNPNKHFVKKNSKIKPLSGAQAPIPGILLKHFKIARISLVNTSGVVPRLNAGPLRVRVKNTFSFLILKIYGATTEFFNFRNIKVMIMISYFMVPWVSWNYDIIWYKLWYHKFWGKKSSNHVIILSFHQNLFLQDKKSILNNNS